MSYEAVTINDSPKSPATSDEDEQNEVQRLRAEVDRLGEEIRDREIALSTSNEHADLLQEHFFRTSKSLSAEIRERQAADEKLQKLLQIVSQEKGDLEVLVQILIDQGDSAAEEGEKARVDGLTQIANRRGFDEFLSREWVRHLRTQKPLSLLIFDVDHFKLYNDHYGHQAGDECLRVVASAIKRCFRSSDLVARYGGEEFAVVLTNTDVQAAILLAERVRSDVATIAAPHVASPVGGRVTVSAGVACKTPQLRDAPDASALIEEADRNLYLAKRRGRNRVSYQDGH